MTPQTRTKWIAVGALALALLPAAFLMPAQAQEAQNPMMQQIALMSRLLNLVGDFTKIAESPSAAGIAATMALDDHFKTPAEAIAFLERVLPQAKDPAVQRAIRIKLADLYKKSAQPQKAVEQLERLITGQPGA